VRKEEEVGNCLSMATNAVSASYCSYCNHRIM